MRARRSTREVIEDHLELSGSGELEDDLDRNYDPDVVCFARDGIHRGHDGVRELAGRLRDQLPGSEFEDATVIVDGDIAFVVWTGSPEQSETFFVRNGRIAAQTSHHFPGQGPPEAARAAKQAPEALHSVEDGS
jgi:hypothetical protein